jgi:hypothetical protein
MTKLQDRTWDHAGFGWYDPAKLLEGYKDVIKAEYMNTMSSAGDWDGLAIVKMGKRFGILPFSQENRFPYRGYRLHTGAIIESINTMPTDDDLTQAYDYLCN